MNVKATKQQASLKINPQGTGAPQNQIASLTRRIKHLTAHLQNNKKDHSSKRGLINLVSKRSRIIRYLQRTNPSLYLQARKEIGFRK